MLIIIWLQAMLPFFISELLVPSRVVDMKLFSVHDDSGNEVTEHQRMDNCPGNGSRAGRH